MAQNMFTIPERPCLLTLYIVIFGGIFFSIPLTVILEGLSQHPGIGLPCGKPFSWISNSEILIHGILFSVFQNAVPSHAGDKRQRNRSLLALRGRHGIRRMGKGECE